MDTQDVYRRALTLIAETDCNVEASSSSDWRRRVQLIALTALANVAKYERDQVMIASPPE
jgi:hypothetical protein